MSDSWSSVGSWVWGSARCAEQPVSRTSADPGGRIAYRPNVIGLVALIVIFALHYLANLAANDDEHFQFILTILLTLGVGETFGWHGMVFWRWRSLSGANGGDARLSSGDSAQP